MYKVRETNDTSETKEEPEKEKENQHRDDSLYNSTCNSSALSSDTPDASQRARSKIGQLVGDPLRSSPLRSSTKDQTHFICVQTRSGSIQSLDRNRPCHTTFSPPVRSTEHWILQEGVMHHTLLATGQPKVHQRSRTHDWLCAVGPLKLYTAPWTVWGEEFLLGSRDESDWQGPGSIGSGLLLGQEPGE